MNEIPKINVIPPGSKTEKFNKRYSKSVAGALPRTSSLVVKDAHGAIVRDIDDNEYIDFVGGFAVVSVGHCNPAVVDAVRNQVGKLIHISAHLGAYEPYLSLAEKIKSIAPGDLKRGKVLFGNSGTEAVEAALKLARYTTRKPSIIAFWPSFHGRTTAALSCTGVSASLKRYMPNVNVSFAPYPYCYRCPFKQEYPDCGLLCVDYFKTMLETTIPPENVAGLIAELISGEPGNIVPPSEFWSTIKKICEENGILFIADEVYTGFGRTGKIFASYHWDLTPDIIDFAKAVAGGMPLGGIIAKKEIIDKWERGAHGTTYGGNPVCCAAGNAALDVILKEKLSERAEKMGEYMLKRLNELKEEHEIIGDARGKGLMVAIELVKDRKKKTPATAKAKKLLQEAHKRGLLVYVAGTYDSVIRMMPPLIISKELIDKGIDILDESLNTLE